MVIEPYPFRARAWWGDTPVAESDACLCQQVEGEPAVLWFPRAHIRLEHFRPDDSRRPSGELGDLTTWSVEAPTTAGHCVLWSPADPPAACAPLAGHGTFDPERVRVEVVDARAGADARDVTVKRFPTWGDAAHLLDLLDVRPDGELRYAGAVHSDGRRPVVEGSQMLGQAVVASIRHAPGRRVVSAAMVFLRAADARRPLRFDLAQLSAGRVFTTLGVQVLQDARCCAAGTLLLHAGAPDVIRHAVDPPDVAGPYECPPYDMGVTGRDIRVLDGAYTNDSGAAVGPPTLDAWVRFRDIPDDPALHAGLLAQFTGHMPIAAAMRPHVGVGQDQAHRTLSTAINAIDLSFHAAVRADEWMLYHHLSTFAGDGMTHAECRVHDAAGALLASFTVDAMVQPFADAAPRDERTAL